MSKRMEAEALKIETYSKKYDNEIITLILDIQNKEFKINLPLQEQPDLLDIGYYYQQQGGEGAADAGAQSGTTNPDGSVNADGDVH